MPPRPLHPVRAAFLASSLLVPSLAAAADVRATDAALGQTFERAVRPFLETYCLGCHGNEKKEAELDLSPYSTVARVVADHGHWELVLERLEAAEMPPAKAKQHPSDEQRRAIVEWIQALRRHEAGKNAGDPGPVLARRLSNAEYDYSIRDLTGVDIRPTKEFPVDPANQAGFDNSGESLTMSPALVKKYLQAARTVAEHLVLKPDGFEFVAHPVVADTDRDKWGVLRIVEFYRRQPTDFADYFAAAWRYQHRAALGRATASLDDIAADARVSPKYLATIWQTLTAPGEEVGPIARLQAMWREFPPPAVDADIRTRATDMREYVTQLRAKIVPEVKNLTAPSIQNGSQTLVMWKNHQMAANRQKFDPTALHVEDIDSLRSGRGNETSTTAEPLASPRPAPAGPPMAAQAAKAPTPPVTPEIVRKGGKFLAPAIVTTGSSATFQMAALKNRGSDPDLAVPADPAERARHEAAFARFAAVFPDAFYITERARVYLDAEKEQGNAGRLLSAGLHSMTGYFRDDGPLYELILDEQGQRELDRLWREFDFASSVPQRMHTSFVWFERTDSSYMRDPEFDPYRPEDKSVTEQAKIAKLGEIYLAKAQRNKASETVQQAIRDHFERVAANIRRVEQDRAAAEPSHLAALERFAARAYRRPLTDGERDSLRRFYRVSRDDNGLDHEEAMRDCIARVLMSPGFCYRIDLLPEAAGSASASASRVPLSDHALASRLSYFLWSSLPDDALLARAAAGELRRPGVLAAEARRMSRDPRIRHFATEFAGHWLDFRRFQEHNAVDRERFPAFDHDLRTAMFEEPVRFLADLVTADRSVLECLYGDHTFVNPPLARHYGIPHPAGYDHERGEDSWTRVERASDYGRGGLLPMAVFLTANSPGLRTSPVKRGYWVVRRVLGERIPPPPAVVPDLPNDEKHLGELTLREVLAKHREDKSCAACHARFDSFGLVFEGYGPVGERRTQDFGGRPVDTRAEFPGGREASGVAGLREYIRTQRENDFVDNLCRKLLAYALGRTLLMSDDPLIADLKRDLAANGHRFGVLLERIVTSEQFRMKRVATPGLASH